MAKASGKSKVNYYAVYKTTKRWESNRKRRLERVLKEQPNNEQVKQALKSMVYRRKTPNTSPWTHSWIRTARLIKSITGRFDPSIMSSNPETARAAMQRPGKVTAETYTPLANPFKSMFSIEARLYKGPAK